MHESSGHGGANHFVYTLFQEPETTALLGSQAAQHEGPGLEAFRGIEEGVFSTSALLLLFTRRGQEPKIRHSTVYKRQVSNSLRKDFVLKPRKLPDPVRWMCVGVCAWDRGG